VLPVGTFERFAEYFDLISQTFVNYEKECDTLEKIWKNTCRKKPKSILDVACGTGSHAVILAKLGYEVTGIDVSKPMIKKAEEKARKKRIRAEFHVQDMRKIKLGRKFDCAICMFGGLGYMLTYQDLTNLFSGLKQHLIRNGLFAFHFWNIRGVRPSPYRSWIRVQDKGLTVYRLSESNFDPQTNIITLGMNFIVIEKDGLVETFSELHKVRCFTLAELRQYLADNGFSLVTAYDWDAEDKTELKVPRRETFGILAVAKSV